MLREATLQDIEKYLDFSYNLSQDLTTSAFPTYLDGIKTKNDFYKSTYLSFSKSNSKILLFINNDEVLGWIDYYWIEQDHYLGFNVFNIQNNQQEAIEEFIEYSKSRYPNYTIYFGFPSDNTLSIEYLKSINSEKIDENYVYTLSFEKYSPLECEGDIVSVNIENWNDFRDLHDKTSDIYWNSNRLFNALNSKSNKKWNIFLYYEKNILKGCIYFVYTPLLMEIFGIDYKDDFDENIMRNLLIKCLNISKLDNQKHTTFFVEEKERKIVESVGFNFITKYELYTISLTD